MTSTAEFNQGDYVLVTNGIIHAVGRVDCGAGVLLGVPPEGAHHLDVCMLGQHLPQRYRADELTPIADADLEAHGFCPKCKGWGLTSMFDNATVDKIIEGEHGETCKRCGGSGRDGVTVWVERTDNQIIGHIDQDPAYLDRLTCELCIKSSTPAMNINDMIDAWHEGPEDRPLHEFLGMTEDQYARWVERRMPDDELLGLGYVDQ